MAKVKLLTQFVTKNLLIPALSQIEMAERKLRINRLRTSKQHTEWLQNASIVHRWNLCQCKELASSHQGHELQTLQKFAVPVLQSVGFVNYHTAPVNLFQLWAVCQDHLKRCDDNMELEDS